MSILTGFKQLRYMRLRIKFTRMRHLNIQTHTMTTRHSSLCVERFMLNVPAISHGFLGNDIHLSHSESTACRVFRNDDDNFHNAHSVAGA